MKEFVLKTKRSKLHNSTYSLSRFLLATLFKIAYRVQVIGLDNIPRKGRIILCSNHISYLDPLVIAAFLPRYIFFMAKREVFVNKFLASVVTFFNSFPVNRDAFDSQAVKYSISILNDEEVIGIFPEGTRSTDGVIRKGYRGVGLISIMADCSILPVALSGTNKIIQKPHKRLFFPKVKIAFGKLIEIKKIIENNDDKTATNIILNKTMDSIKDLYNKLNQIK